MKNFNYTLIISSGYFKHKTLTKTTKEVVRILDSINKVVVEEKRKTQKESLV
jgi:hypothetical protein